MDFDRVLAKISSLSLSPSLLLSLSPSLLTLSPSLPLSLYPSLPLSLSPSIPLSLSPSPPLSLNRILLLLRSIKCPVSALCFATADFFALLFLRRYLCSNLSPCISNIYFVTCTVITFFCSVWKSDCPANGLLKYGFVGGVVSVICVSVINIHETLLNVSGVTSLF